MKKSVDNFLNVAYNYLLNYGELSQEERDEREATGKILKRTKEETLRIINDDDLFIDTYDVLIDELDYTGLNLETVLQYNKQFKQN